MNLNFYVSLTLVQRQKLAVRCLLLPSWLNKLSPFYHLSAFLATEIGTWVVCSLLLNAPLLSLEFSNSITSGYILLQSNSISYLNTYTLPKYISTSNLTIILSLSPSIACNAFTLLSGLMLLYKVTLGRYMWKRQFQPSSMF